MRFLAHLKHTYKLTPLTCPQRSLLNYASASVCWDNFQNQNRYYSFKPFSPTSKFLRNRKFGKRFKHNFDKYKSGSISKQRRLSKSSSNISPVAVISNADQSQKIALIPINLFDGKQDDANAFQEALSILAILRENSRQVAIFADTCTRLKNVGSGAGVGMIGETLGGDEANVFGGYETDIEKIPVLSDVIEPSESTYYVKRNKKVDEKSSLPLASISHNTATENPKTFSFGLPMNIVNELKEIPVHGMQLNFEMDITNIKQALLNQNNLPSLSVKSEKPADSTLALSTNFRMDPSDTKTIPLQFNASIYGTVDINPKEFSVEQIKNLKVPKFNEYVTAVAANLCSAALQKGFPTDVCTKVYSTESKSNSSNYKVGRDLMERHKSELSKSQNTELVMDEMITTLVQTYADVPHNVELKEEPISKATTNDLSAELLKAESLVPHTEKTSKVDPKTSPPYTEKQAEVIKDMDMLSDFSLLDAALYHKSVEAAKRNRGIPANVGSTTASSKTGSLSELPFKNYPKKTDSKDVATRQSSSKCGSGSKDKDSKDPCKPGYKNPSKEDPCKPKTKKLSSSSKCGTVNPCNKASKTEPFKKSIKDDPCKKSSKADCCKKASKTDPCKKSSKTEPFKKSIKADPCKKSSKTQLYKKSSKPNPCKKVPPHYKPTVKKSDSKPAEAGSKCRSSSSSEACSRASKIKPDIGKKPLKSELKSKCGRPDGGDTSPNCKGKHKSKSKSSIRKLNASKSDKKKSSQTDSSKTKCRQCPSKRELHTLSTPTTHSTLKYASSSCYISTRKYGKCPKDPRKGIYTPESEASNEYRIHKCQQDPWKDNRKRRKRVEKKKSCYEEEEDGCPDTACYRLYLDIAKKGGKNRNPNGNNCFSTDACFCVMAVYYISKEENKSRSKNAFYFTTETIGNCIRPLLKSANPFGYQRCNLSSTVRTNQEAVIEAPFKIGTRTLAIPQVFDNDVLVCVDSVALSDSDVHMFETGAENYPGITLGNEAAGFVDQVGRNVTNLKVGDRVVVEPGLPCGRCNLCLTGHYNLCTHITFSGCLRKYCTHPANFCHKICPNVPLEYAAFAYQVALGCNACYQARISPNSNIVIIGSCAMAVCTTMCALSMGARNVCVMCEVKQTQDLIEEYVTKKVNCFNDDDTPKSLVKMIISSLEASPDVVINCSSSTKTMNAAIMALKPAGVCVVSGFLAECASFNIMDALMKEIHILPSFRSKNMFPFAINLLESGALPVSCLLANCCCWNELDGAFQSALAESNCGPRKTIVLCNVGDEVGTQTYKPK